MRSLAIGSIFLLLLTAGPTTAFAADSGKAVGESKDKSASSPENLNGSGAEESKPLPAEMAAEVAQLKQALQEQARQYEQQHTIDVALQNRLAALESELTILRGAAAKPGDLLDPVNKDSVAVRQPADQQGTDGKSSDASPLFFKIGKANFTPAGFLDFTTVFRTRTVGSGIGTAFGTIPYNVAAGYPAAGLSEVRMSEQNSRLSLKVDSTVKSAKVYGYVETDFLGNNATTMDVTSNSATLRLRLAFADVSMGHWEVLAGQGWSLMTPNRKGLSPMTSDVFYSQDNDTNYQLGVIWARQPQFRVVYHPNSSWAVGFSAENPQQFIGSALTLPSAFASSQADTNGASWGANTNTPNLQPDLVTKVAYDAKVGNRAFHVDAAGIYRTFKINTFVAATNTTPQINENSTAGGFGGSLNANLELFKNFHLIENAFWSDGGGRYVFGLAPDFVVRPANSAGVYTISPVHSGSGLLGFEWQARPSLMVYGYYSGIYASRNYANVIPGTVCGALGSCGYGFPGSANTTNRDIQEATLGIGRTFWSSPALGKLAVLAQASYLTRNPWSIAKGTPDDANLAMGFISLRYVLP